jgi:hypothetical protein
MAGTRKRPVRLLRAVNGRKTKLSTQFAGQDVDERDSEENIRLVSTMHYNLGFLEDQSCRLACTANPFDANLTHVSGTYPTRSGAPGEIRTPDHLVRRRNANFSGLTISTTCRVTLVAFVTAGLYFARPIPTNSPQSYDHDANDFSSCGRGTVGISIT